MREEIKQMQRSLDAVLIQDLRRADAEGDPTGILPETRGFSPRPNTPPEELVSPARPISARETSRREAPRGSSPGHPAFDDEQQHGPEALKEPMGSLFEVTKLRSIRNNQTTTQTSHSRGRKGTCRDLITRGVIPEARAQELYNIFMKSLNHYLWVGLEQIHPSWQSVRVSSELLATAILTVTALHLPSCSEIFDSCYKQLLSLISSSMFSRYHSVDDVRGLCISAFWLSEHSWKLTGHAIRIATELGIHRSFLKALEGDREHFLKARLWYMLYICDRHFSIAYGRPPTVEEGVQIRQHELLLASPLFTNLDIRILSQVSLMSLLTHVYGRFSMSEQSLPGAIGVNGLSTAGHGHDDRQTGSSAFVLSEADLPVLRSYNLEVDHWRMRWYPRQLPSPFIGEFTNKGVVLYSYFAKLQINSLAIRGVFVNFNQLSSERKEFANMAISAASNILTFMQEEEDLRRSLVGTPVYVHTMIAFASVFLVKAATKWSSVVGLNIDYANIVKLLDRMVEVLRAAVTSDRHMLKHIGEGLEVMLDRMRKSGKEEDKAQGAAAGMRPNDLGREQNGEYGSNQRQGTFAVAGNDQGFKGSREQLLNGAHPQNQSWDTASYPINPNQTGNDPRLNFPAEDMDVLNENFMYQSFGTGSAGDLHNMFSSQFLY
ncbi:C6 transcription factor [Colletotrichum plurivorum]|uniref:C6 transcription factor n=1 Tax=Colletotrichum plurivorum TaxID=2175906 RepID=A0A8H6JU41_9PEZI|nr:C6 transcription factor [Colletotrichum plurivorum]